MAVEVDGIYQILTPTQDNAFVLSDGGPFAFPLKVQLTSILGDTIDDVLATGPIGVTQGAAQYPLNSTMDQVNTTPSAGASVQSGEQGQVQACNVTLEPFSQCGGRNILGVDAQIPGSCCPDGFSCVRQNIDYWQCIAGPMAPTEAPGGGMEAPTTAPAAEEAPNLPPLPSQTPLLCQLVQELLNENPLASSCRWSVA